MLYALVLGIHIVVCLVLILVVLLQAGRGGGFSDMLGGGQPQTLFGTQTNAFMLKATEVCAVLFILTSLTLGILSTQEGKSLVSQGKMMRDIQAQLPAAVTAQTTIKEVPVSADEAAKMPETASTPVVIPPEPAKANAT